MIPFFDGVVDTWEYAEVGESGQTVNLLSLG